MIGSESGDTEEEQVAMTGGNELYQLRVEGPRLASSVQGKSSTLYGRRGRWARFILIYNRG